MDSHPTVSAIVPVRNEEATIAAAVESLAAQPEIGEIFAVNDQSSDGTAGVLEKLSSRFGKLRVLQTTELPAGWVGKNYAVSLGAAQASGDWLLFTSQVYPECSDDDCNLKHLEEAAQSQSFASR